MFVQITNYGLTKEINNDKYFVGNRNEGYVKSTLSGLK